MGRAQCGRGGREGALAGVRASCPYGRLRGGACARPAGTAPAGHRFHAGHPRGIWGKTRSARPAHHGHMHGLRGGDCLLHHSLVRGQRGVDADVPVKQASRRAAVTTCGRGRAPASKQAGLHGPALPLLRGGGRKRVIAAGNTTCLSPNLSPNVSRSFCVARRASSCPSNAMKACAARRGHASAPHLPRWLGARMQPLPRAHHARGPAVRVHDEAAGRQQGGRAAGRDGGVAKRKARCKQARGRVSLPT